MGERLAGAMVSSEGVSARSHLHRCELAVPSFNGFNSTTNFLIAWT